MKSESPVVVIRLPENSRPPIPCVIRPRRPTALRKPSKRPRLWPRSLRPIAGPGRSLTKQEEMAQRKARAEAAERERLEAAAKPTFKTYAEAWLKSVALDHALSTVTNYTKALARAGERFNDYKLEDITPNMVREYLTDLQAEGSNRQTGGKLSYSTYFRQYVILDLLFQSAEDNEIINRSPMAKIKRPKRPKDAPPNPRDVFSPDEVSYILECIQKEPLKWQATIAFMLDSGCRRGEVVDLKWESVNFSTGKVTIEANSLYTAGTGVYVTTPKSGKIRSFPLSPRRLAIMRQWKKEQTLYCLSKGIPNSGYCFTGENGKMMHPQTLTNRFADFFKRYDIPGFHPHALRHTMISLSITNGADVVSVSKRAGHADPSITLKVYSHVNEEAQQRASDILDQVIYKNA